MDPVTIIATLNTLNQLMNLAGKIGVNVGAYMDAKRLAMDEGRDLTPEELDGLLAASQQSIDALQRAIDERRDSKAGKGEPNHETTERKLI